MRVIALVGIIQRLGPSKIKGLFKKMSEFDRKIITDAITRMLARREHSFDEICKKLSLKGIERSVVLPILQEFCDADIQSDERFAESRARMLAAKGQGPRKIKLDLQQYGVDEYIAEIALNETDVDWFESARQVRIKKFGSPAKTEFKDVAKQKQFLQYRGFYSDHITFAVNDD